MYILMFNQTCRKHALAATILHQFCVVLTDLPMIFFNRCVSCYNSLPLNVINSNSLTVFKNYISNLDLTNYIKCSYLQLA